ncbi:hypothetical protein [Actinoplanes sp. NPDC051851]|uniref:hypothetical protein n=1 Tax=Actinoplanes sp. NPDC051851 TaxID=3154753 RepID=UPI003434C916
MRTLDDLRRSLDEHAGSAPDGFGMVERARTGAGRIRRRRRILQGAAAVVAVLATAVAVPVALRERASAPIAPAAKPYRTAEQYSLTLAADSAFVVPWHTLDRTRQILSVANAAAVVADRPEEVGGNTGAQVVAFDPGVFDPADLRAGEAVTVSGQRAWYAAALPFDYATVLPMVDTTPIRMNVPAVGWEGASGVWIVVYRPQRSTPAASTRAELLEVARDVRLRDTLETVRSPFHLGWLPSGLTADALELHDLAQLAGKSVSVAFGDGTDARALSVMAQPAAGDRDWETIRPELGEPEKVAGYDVWYQTEKASGLVPGEGGSVTSVVAGTCHLSISVEDRNRITEADVHRLLTGLTLGKCADVSTWRALL